MNLDEKVSFYQVNKHVVFSNSLFRWKVVLRLMWMLSNNFFNWFNKLNYRLNHLTTNNKTIFNSPSIEDRQLSISKQVQWIQCKNKWLGVATLYTSKAKVIRSRKRKISRLNESKSWSLSETFVCLEFSRFDSIEKTDRWNHLSLRRF